MSNIIKRTNTRYYSTRRRKFTFKRKRKNQTLKTELLLSWKQFCDRTKLAGLNLIGGNRKSRLKRRLTLFTVWILCLSLASYKCGLSIRKYFNYDVATVVTYQSESNLQYPAITFCNVIGLRKSVLGVDKRLISLLSHMMLMNDTELTLVRREVNSYTYSPTCSI